MSKTCKINYAKTMKRSELAGQISLRLFLIQGPKRFPMLASTPHHYPD